MKLLKKLLPIVTVASVASVVTPLTVSCGNNAKGISELGFIPDIPMHEKKSFETAADAQKEYFSNVESNPEIFVQDFYWSQSQIQKMIFSELYEYTDKSNFDFYFCIQNVSATSTTVESVTYYLMSFDLDYTWKLSSKDDDFSEGYKVTYSANAHSERHMHFTNVPFMLYWEESGYDRWEIAIGATPQEMVTISPDFEIKADVNVVSTIVETSKYGTRVREDDSRNYNFNITVNKDYAKYPTIDYSLLGTIFTNTSYYFLNCGLND